VKKKSELDTARDQVAAARAAVAAQADKLAALGAEMDAAAAVLRSAEAKIGSLRIREAVLRQKVTDAEAVLDAAEDREVEALCIALAAEIVKRQSSDPLKHAAWVIEAVERLRKMVRSGFDQPVNAQTGTHPLVTQALGLLPRRNEIDCPVYELGGIVAPKTSWPVRRRQILAEASV
jgi:hypothetical protein